MKKKLNILLVLIIALVASSCQGFLDKAPILDQSNEITMSSYSGLNKAVAGAYSPLYSTSWYGGDFILSSEMRSGNGWRFLDGEFQSGRYSIEYNWNYSEDVTSGQWGFTYFVSMAANNVLANLEGKTGGEVTEQDINNLKAEALFLRALSHFDAVLLYGQPYNSGKDTPGIPYVKVTDPLAKPARDNVGIVYDNIIADLLEAEQIIAPNYVRDGFKDAKASVSLPAIQALLSRVYLYMSKWQEAADYATKVISNTKYTLWTSEEYSKVWGVDVPKDGEVIFEVYGTKNNDYFGSWENISHVVNPEGYGDVCTSKDLLSVYEEGDIRRTLYRTDKGDKSGGRLWSTKFTGKGEGTPDCCNVIVLRLSEMYLNRAEAIMNGASVSGATAIGDLNTIRAQRGLADLSSAAFGDIQRERRLELAFEGHYLFDLARWGKPVNRTDFTGSTNQNIDFPSYKWALPIRKSELEVNENLVQNEGY